MVKEFLGFWHLSQMKKQTGCDVSTISCILFIYCIAAKWTGLENKPQCWLNFTTLEMQSMAVISPFPVSHTGSFELRPASRFFIPWIRGSVKHLFSRRASSRPDWSLDSLAALQSVCDWCKYGFLFYHDHCIVIRKSVPHNRESFSFL